jgi:FMN phosphatase YigB (HAD superfamily)
MTAGYETRALLFDVFGTVVDWRSGIARELKAWGDERGLRADWPKVADAWRGLYQPAMERVRSGNRGLCGWTFCTRKTCTRCVTSSALASRPGPTCTGW